jgi:hypothetical protein
MKKILSLFILIALTGCTGSDVKTTLGLRKKAPDEFMVLSRPALTVPPAFDLPEPETTQTATPKDFSSNAAKKVLFGAEAGNKDGKKSTAENLFLNKAGFGSAQSDIREQLEQDARALEEPTPEEAQEKGFFERLFEPLQLNEAPDPIVSPVAEKERIKDAKASGEKIDGEDAVTVQPKAESTLDRILGR